MPRVPRIALAALVVVVSAPAAAASAQDRGGVVRPVTSVGGVTAGGLISQSFVHILEIPAPKNPERGFGNPCIKIAGGNVLAPVAPPGNSPTCTVKRGTPVLIYFGAFCSNVEPPPFHAIGEEAQRACALAANESAESLKIIIDGGKPVQIRKKRYELYSPHTTVQLPENNLLEVPAGPADFTAHAWAALVRKLKPGKHVIALRIRTAEFKATPKGTIIVRRAKR